MIILTRYNDGSKVYIDERDILRVTDGHDLAGARSFPYTEVELEQKEDKTKDGKNTSVIWVMESAKNVGRLMIEAMHRRRMKHEPPHNSEPK